MNTRSLLAALAVTTLLFGASVAAPAAPAKKSEQTDAAMHNAHAGHGGSGVQQPVLTPEKEALFRTIMDESDAKIVPLKEQMYAKNLELKALAQNPNTPRETITALSKDVAALKTQIGQEMKSRNDRIEKEVGLVKPFGGKMGGHMGGHMGGKMDGKKGGKMNHGGCGGCEMSCQ